MKLAHSCALTSPRRCCRCADPSSAARFSICSVAVRPSRDQLESVARRDPLGVLLVSTTTSLAAAVGTERPIAAILLESTSITTTGTRHLAGDVLLPASSVRRTIAINSATRLRPGRRRPGPGDPATVGPGLAAESRSSPAGQRSRRCRDGARARRTRRGGGSLRRGRLDRDEERVPDGSISTSQDASDTGPWPRGT